MIQAFLGFWVISALLAVIEKKTVRTIIYLGVFSLVSSLCFFMFAAPDVALADIVVNAFMIIFFIVCLERYYDLNENASEGRTAGPGISAVCSYILPAVFAAGLFALFAAFIPGESADGFLKDRYIAGFMEDIGGENAVTAIYLGYRVYDTLFETLMLLICVVAVAHLSWYKTAAGKKHEAAESEIALPVIRLISPLLLLFGVYLIVNGHTSPGGGFQGGVVIAAFFICRYLVFDIYDIRVEGYITIEKMAFIGIVLLAVFFMFIGVDAASAIPQNIYLIIMNSLIGMKVAWGFIVILYRYIAFERWQ